MAAEQDGWDVQGCCGVWVTAALAVTVVQDRLQMCSLPAEHIGIGAADARPGLRTSAGQNDVAACLNQAVWIGL